MKRSLVIACLFTAGASATAEEVVLDKDVPFGRTGDTELKLDLYRPKSHVDDASTKLPGLVVIFGGGFSRGNKEMMRIACEQFARAGFVVVAPDYRLVPHVQFPAPIEDCKCAVRWMRANAAKYRIDSEHIGAMGISAGGYLAMMLGYTEPSDGFEGDGGHSDQSSKVQAVINYFGAFDLTLNDWKPKDEPRIIDFLGNSIVNDPELYRRGSPRTYVDGQDAPTLTLHGTRDPLVPYGQGVLVDTTLLSVGVDSELHLVPGGSHGWWGKQLQETQQHAIEFLDRHLRGGSSTSEGE